MSRAVSTASRSVTFLPLTLNDSKSLIQKGFPCSLVTHKMCVTIYCHCSLIHLRQTTHGGLTRVLIHLACGQNLQDKNSCNNNQGDSFSRCFGRTLSIAPLSQQINRASHAIKAITQFSFEQIPFFYSPVLNPLEVDYEGADPFGLWPKSSKQEQLQQPLHGQLTGVHWAHPHKTASIAASDRAFHTITEIAQVSFALTTVPKNSPIQFHPEKSVFLKSKVHCCTVK